MKKLITLFFGSMFALAASAQSRQPMVTVHAPSDFEVHIDGIRYTSGNNPTIPNLAQGTHAVQVYQLKPGLFGKKRELVSTTSFTLRDRDVTITVDQYGQARISENGTRVGESRKNRGRTDNTWAKGKGRDRTYENDDDDYDDDDDYSNDRKYKKEKKAKKAKSSNGRGKKLGHYKH